jgi:hypothetical protein
VVAAADLKNEHENRTEEFRSVRFILARVRQKGGNWGHAGCAEIPTNQILEPVQHHPSQQTQVLEQETMKKANNERQNTKRSVGIMIAIGMALGIGSAVAQPGNGALSGPHYNLNIIGTENCPGDDLVGTGRHVIFVELFGGEDPAGKSPSELTPQNKIYLFQGDTFEVLDGNACDGRAEFQLPPPDDYLIFIRPLGQPGGGANIALCATDVGDPLDPLDDVIVCSSGHELIRSKGQSKFVNVTDELTKIETTEGTVSLFDPELQDFFWNFNNDGLRLAQLRFYPILQ